jgi:RNA recognition motif. (a.k.a. RRM, RBD, or RNP domain)
MSHQNCFKSLFVGGLKSDTTKEQVSACISEFTDVISVKIAQDRKLKQPKGYALVKVPIDADVSKLLNSRHNINGRRVDIQLAAKRSEKQQCLEEAKRRKLFMKDIDRTISNEVFEAEITKTPGVKSGYIIRDFHTKESNGYGFLELVSEEAAQKLLETGILILGVRVALVPYKYKFEPKSSTDPDNLGVDHSNGGLLIDGNNCIEERRNDSGEISVRTDSHREAADEAITMKACSHGKSSPSSVPENASRRSQERTHKKTSEYLLVQPILNQAVENYRFNLSARARVL